MGNDNYATPNWLLDCFTGWFDPCPLNETPEFDGLTIEWEERTYCNPPYSEPHKWVKKAIEESNKGKLVVMLLRCDTSTKWFRELIAANAEILLFSRRIKFSGKTPYFASMLVILNGRDPK